MGGGTIENILVGRFDEYTVNEHGCDGAGVPSVVVFVLLIDSRKRREILFSLRHFAKLA
jgi:hypothetical protein